MRIIILNKNYKYYKSKIYRSIMVLIRVLYCQ